MAEDPRSVVAYDETVVEAKLKPFLDLTRSLGGESLIEQVTLVEKEFAGLRAVILTAASCQKPDQKTFGELLGPLQTNIEAITRLRHPSRKDKDWTNHFITVAEGAPCVGWITVEPKPVPFVEAIKQSIEYYGNKIIQEYKDKDPKHAQWVRGYYGLLDAMRVYVKEYHTTGLVWNAKGVPVSQYKAGPAAGAPPPPPPPPQPTASPSTSAKAPGGGAAAVFAELNQGEAVTKGLRKVDKSEMTHKNPSLRAGSAVPERSTSPIPGKKPTRPSKPQSLMGKKPPKFALEGTKWAIEYQENEPSLVVENAQLNQIVNIFGCKKTVIVIKGKVNAVTLVNCTKTSVLIESVISSVSVTNSPSFTIQITGAAPMIQVDSTDSGQIYLSKDSLHTEITTAKCSSINVSLPVAGEEEGVFAEQAVPEMLKTVIQDGKLVTTVVEHIG
jgi:adenylyl cyclase-associated protein